MHVDGLIEGSVVGQLDLVRCAVAGRNPVQRTEACIRGYRVDGGSLVRREHFVDVVRGREGERAGGRVEAVQGGLLISNETTLSRYPRRGGDEGTHRPRRESEMLQHRRISSHHDNIAIPLKANHLHGLCAAPLHKRPVHAVRIALVAAPVLAHENLLIARLVVPQVEHVHEVVWAAVVVVVVPDARDGGVGEAVRVDVVGDQRDIGVCGVDGVVDEHQPAGVSIAASGVVVFIADFDVLDVPGFCAAVGGAGAAPGRGRRTKEVLLVRRV